MMIKRKIIYIMIIMKIDKKGKLTLKNQNMKDNLINQKLNKDIKEKQILFKMNK
jgi:hypothetical protein